MNQTEFKSGKYLTFSIDGEDYGVEILKVKEIIGLMDITKVPNTPKYVRGVINLRGMVIPVIDIRKKFGLTSAADTRETSVIVVEISRNSTAVSTGMLVDSVSEVMDVAKEDINEAPSFGGGHSTDYILGMAKTNGSVRILINVDMLLNDSETAELSGLTQAGNKNSGGVENVG